MGVLGCSVVPRWFSSLISLTPDAMCFVEIPLGSINYGTEPLYSAFLFHPWGICSGFLLPLSSCKLSGNFWDFCVNEVTPNSAV